MLNCGHRLCAIIGGACSVAVTRSRGCRPNVEAEIDPDLVDQLRDLIARVDDPAAATRLAQIVRREALAGRNLIALVTDADAEVATALARLVRR